MSHLEERFIRQFAALNAGRFPQPKRDYVYTELRKWEFDFAWPEYKVAVDIDGGTAIRGRHSRPKGMGKDHEKRNEATRQGWRVLVFSNYNLQNIKRRVSACRLLLDILTQQREYDRA